MINEEIPICAKCCRKMVWVKGTLLCVVCDSQLLWNIRTPSTYKEQDDWVDKNLDVNKNGK